VVTLLWLAACGSRTASPELACGSSYLEAAVRDLLQQPVPMLRLAEPGTCPGHFDIRPSQAAALRQCRLLLRFDFQNALDGQVEAGSSNGPAVGVVSVRGGMCVPATYLAVCEQILPHLARWQQRPPEAYQSQFAAIRKRMQTLEHTLHNQVREAALAGVPIVASKRQRDFCEWLGLRVVADFTGADIARPSELEKAVKEGRAAGARLVIANLPEGRKAADFIAEALGARVVVLGNFPLPSDSGPDFDALLQDNVQRLLQASR
jgi:zinc transport system substrate-binding protein